MKKLITLTLLFIGGSAQAIPVTWTIDSLFFDDGGTASGSFIFDADTDTYSAVSIVTTAGSVLGGTTYNFPSQVVCGGSGGCLFVEADTPDLTGTSGLFMLLAPGLTNSGGVVGIDYGQEAPCAVPDCSGDGAPTRFVTSGQITGVPIPAAVWLFGSALLGLGWFRRKQTV